MNLVSYCETLRGLGSSINEPTVRFHMNNIVASRTGSVHALVDFYYAKWSGNNSVVDPSKKMEWLVNNAPVSKKSFLSIRTLRNRLVHDSDVSAGLLIGIILLISKLREDDENCPYVETVAKDLDFLCKLIIETCEKALIKETSSVPVPKSCEDRKVSQTDEDELPDATPTRPISLYDIKNSELSSEIKGKHILFQSGARSGVKGIFKAWNGTCAKILVNEQIANITLNTQVSILDSRWESKIDALVIKPINPTVEPVKLYVLKKGEWLLGMKGRRVIFLSGSREGKKGLFKGWNGSSVSFLVDGAIVSLSLNTLVLVLEQY